MGRCGSPATSRMRQNFAISITATCFSDILLVAQVAEKALDASAHPQQVHHLAQFLSSRIADG